jgi:NAD(P)-dependent dehydrogenase (short-subunit alcohol dehydrogenase family)
MPLTSPNISRRSPAAVPGLELAPFKIRVNAIAPGVIPRPKAILLPEPLKGVPAVYWRAKRLSAGSVA